MRRKFPLISHEMCSTQIINFDIKVLFMISFSRPFLLFCFWFGSFKIMDCKFKHQNVTVIIVRPVWIYRWHMSHLPLFEPWIWLYTLVMLMSNDKMYLDSCNCWHTWNRALRSMNNLKILDFFLIFIKVSSEFFWLFNFLAKFAVNSHVFHFDLSEFSKFFLFECLLNQHNSGTYFMTLGPDKLL